MTGLVTDAFLSVYYVSHMRPNPEGRATLNLLEDNEADIKMTIKRRSPALRHVVRTHRVNLDLMFEFVDGSPSFWLRIVRTSDQMADLLNKGQFTAEPFAHICNFAQVGHFMQYAQEQC